MTRIGRRDVIRGRPTLGPSALPRFTIGESETTFHIMERLLRDSIIRSEPKRLSKAIAGFNESLLCSKDEAQVVISFVVTSVAAYDRFSMGRLGIGQSTLDGE